MFKKEKKQKKIGLNEIEKKKEKKNSKEVIEFPHLETNSILNFKCST